MKTRSARGVLVIDMFKNAVILPIVRDQREPDTDGIAELLLQSREHVVRCKSKKELNELINDYLKTGMIWENSQDESDII